jgi:hypothetical protein
VFEPVWRLNQKMMGRLELPTAKWMRRYSYEHWVIGSLGQALFIVGVLACLSYIRPGETTSVAWVLIYSSLFALSSAWLISFNRWRSRTGRQ